MHSEVQTPTLSVEHRPPTPRLSAGSLLRGDVEVAALLTSHGGKNIYEAHDEFGAVLLLEQATPVMQLAPMTESLAFHLYAWPEIFVSGERAYAMFPHAGAMPWKNVELPCQEERIVWFLSHLLDSVSVLLDSGVDISLLGPDDIYILQDYPHVLTAPYLCIGPQDPRPLLAALTEHLLFVEVLPRVTRNLNQPLRCLGLSLESEEVLGQFLQDRDISKLRSWLDRRIADESPDWDCQGITHTGNVREHNEDALGWCFNHTQTHSRDSQFGIMAVSDGMGGHLRGEEASHLALTTTISYCSDFLEHQPARTDPDMERLMGHAFDQAAVQVFNAFNEIKVDERPGATLVAALVIGRKLYLGNCGDSRAYLYYQGQLTQLSRDHSLLQLYVDRGMLTAEEVDDCDNHVITSFIGMEQRAYKKDVYTRYLPTGARLLLCSDGLTDMVRPPQIRDILAETRSSRTAARKLLALALANGGHDNVTVLVLTDRSADDGQSPGENQ